LFVVEVRRAGGEDLVAVRRVADAAIWEAYTGLLDESTISALLQRDFSPASLRRRLTRGEVLVADDAGRVVGFAEAVADEDGVRLLCLGVDGRDGHRAAAAALLGEVRRLACRLPVSADVLLGCLPVEGCLEEAGFVPGETLALSLFGQEAVARRWWLAPP
jgi:hypothetical protein